MKPKPNGEACPWPASWIWIQAVRPDPGGKPFVIVQWRTAKFPPPNKWRAKVAPGPYTWTYI